ncbi:MAG TPA: hypothetical protein EYP39_02245 [Ghiorsea sp.]|nr:hypothetical protein [Ghiorsea sp.]HIP08042.1 hypothetical protein [Mariprofundaceae bacterium]
MSFWLKPRQIVVMDSQSSGPAKNFTTRYISLFLLLLIVSGGPFVLGAWYAPFHQVQKIIPENMKLKRQNIQLERQVADAQTLNDLKDEQLSSLKEQISLQEAEIVNINNQLHMYKSILDQRKGTGIHVLESKASFANTSVSWNALFVKGGSYPRYLVGRYKLFALDEQGNKIDLNKEIMRYRIESHMFLQKTFEWTRSWQPTKLELVVYNARLKEVLRKIIPIQGK